jgi:hypothetical protein
VRSNDQKKCWGEQDRVCKSTEQKGREVMATSIKYKQQQRTCAARAKQARQTDLRE